MIDRIRAVLEKLSIPSAQRDSWFSWASAQLAHAFIGTVLAGAALQLVAPVWALLAASVGYGLVKEVPDFFRNPGWGTARDCAQDALFVTSGAAVAVALEGSHEIAFFSVVVAAIIGLWVGVSDRIKREGTR